jgi:hypothetical protein
LVPRIIFKDPIGHDEGAGGIVLDFHIFIKGIVWGVHYSDDICFGLRSRCERRRAGWGVRRSFRRSDRTGWRIRGGAGYRRSARWRRGACRLRSARWRAGAGRTRGRGWGSVNKWQVGHVVRGSHCNGYETKSNQKGKQEFDSRRHRKDPLSDVSFWKLARKGSKFDPIRMNCAQSVYYCPGQQHVTQLSLRGVLFATKQSPPLPSMRLLRKNRSQ